MWYTLSKPSKALSRSVNLSKRQIGSLIPSKIDMHTHTPAHQVRIALHGGGLLQTEFVPLEHTEAWPLGMLPNHGRHSGGGARVCAKTDNKAASCTCSNCTDVAAVKSQVSESEASDV